MKLNINATKWIILLFLITLFSCVNSDGRKNSVVEESMEEKSKEKLEILEFKLKDTISLDEIVTGNILYNTALEKIEESNISSRYIFFHYSINEKNQVLSLEEIKEDEKSWIQEDTLGNGRFEFKFQYSTKENEPNKRKVFHGAIEDIRILKSKDTTQNTVVEKKEILLTRDLIINNINN